MLNWCCKCSWDFHSQVDLQFTSKYSFYFIETNLSWQIYRGNTRIYVCHWRLLFTVCYHSCLKSKERDFNSPGGLFASSAFTYKHKKPTQNYLTPGLKFKWTQTGTAAYLRVTQLPKYTKYQQEYEQHTFKAKAVPLQHFTTKALSVKRLQCVKKSEVEPGGFG